MPSLSPTASDATPAYARIAGRLRERLSSLAAHTLLPSEREMSEEFGVSRMTARHAVSVLEAEGLVYRRPPVGTFVAEPRVLFQIGSFTEQVARQGLEPQARLLDAVTERAPEAARTALQLPARAEVHALRRLRLVGDVPVAIERTYIPANLAPSLLDHDLHGSVWEVLQENFGVRLVQARAIVESRPLDGESSSLLDVRVGAPGIVLERTTTDQDGQPVEYALDTYRSDRAAFEFTQTLNR